MTIIEDEDYPVGVGPLGFAVSVTSDPASEVNSHSTCSTLLNSQHFVQSPFVFGFQATVVMQDFVNLVLYVLKSMGVDLGPVEELFNLLSELAGGIKLDLTVSAFLSPSWVCFADSFPSVQIANGPINIVMKNDKIEIKNSGISLMLVINFADVMASIGIPPIGFMQAGEDGGKQLH